MKRNVALAALLLLIPALAGCWDRSEIEDQAYVVMVGLDRDPQAAYVVTALVAVVQELGAGTGRSPVTQDRPRLAATNLTARARTLEEALQVLNGGMTRRLDMRHLRAVVVGEELGRAGLEPLVIELLRSPLARTSGIFLQAVGTAHEVLGALRPVAEINPAHTAEGITLQSKQMHLAPPVLLHHFLNRLAGGGGDSYLPMIAINRAVESGADLPEPVRSNTAKPGVLPRAGGNPVEVVGTGMFRRDRLVGVLNVDETQMLLALRGKMGKTPLTVPDPLAPGQAITMRLHQENFPQYQAAFRQGHPYVAVHLLFEGELLAVPSQADYAAPQARQTLERAVAGFVTETAGGMMAKLRDWQVDPIGFGQLYRGRFRSWEAWNAFNWPGRVGAMEVRVSAELRVRRYGLVLGHTRLNRGR